MLAQDKLRHVVIREFAKRQARNGHYSLQAYAKSLKMGAPALSEIMRGKRRVSREKAKAILLGLSINPDEMKVVLSYFGRSSARSAKIEVCTLDGEKYQAVSEWYHFAILSLSQTRDFSSDAVYIARRLGISETVAQNAVERLLRLGLMKREGEELKAAQTEISSPDEIQSFVLQKAHRNNLRLAELSLDKDPVDKRDFFAITMAVDPAKLPVAKQLIREFIDNLSQILESDNQQEVYKACIQLFPLSH